MRDFILSILKILFFIAIIPIGLAVTMAFRRELYIIPTDSQGFFYNGIILYILLYLFVYDFKEIHLTAQGITAEIFKLVPPIDRLAPYFFPIFCLLTLLVYALFGLLLKTGPSLEYYFGVLGFTLTLHLVMTAREFYDEDKHLWKPNYFFSISLSYIATIFIIVLAVDWVVPSFSFVHFFHKLYQSTNDSYESAFKFFWKLF